MNNTKGWLAVALCALTTNTFAASNDTVANDGMIPTPATITGNLVDNGYVGTGVTSSLSLLGGSAAPTPTAEVQRIAELPPLSPSLEVDIMPRAVFGLDTKVQLKPSTYPYRAVTLITIGNSRCSGWLASADTVITAGHCVNKGNGGSWYTLTDYTIYPGHDGTTAPYGKCTAKRLYTTEGWALEGKAEYDYGAIKLNCSIGNATGWLGFAAPTTIAKLPALISGYPGDKPLGQWGSFDVIKREDSNWAYYRNDTYAGMSGAPVWYDAGRSALVLAIHTYSIPNFNRGARINASVFKNIKTWKNAQ